MSAPVPGELRGGVRRVPGRAAPVAARLAEAGWDIALVPPAVADTDLWDGLAEALALPTWFGRNLDALDEALAGLSRPTALVLAAWWTYATARPQRWSSLLRLLDERTTVAPPLLVVLAD